MSLTVRMKFARRGAVRYIGHLDMLRYFQKAVLRSAIPARYSEGFHPHQLMSFAYPLGVAMETEGDYLDLELTEHVPAEELLRRMNEVMREGIALRAVTYLPEGVPNAMAAVEAADYTLRAAAADGRSGAGAREAQLRAAAEALLARESILIEAKKGGGKDIREGILSLRVEGDFIRMRLLSGSRLNVRPADVWEELRRGLPQPEAWELSALCREEIYGLTKEGEYLPLDMLAPGAERAAL